MGRIHLPCREAEFDNNTKKLYSHGHLPIGQSPTNRSPAVPVLDRSRPLTQHLSRVLVMNRKVNETALRRPEKEASMPTGHTSRRLMGLLSMLFSLVALIICWAPVTFREPDIAEDREQDSDGRSSRQGSRLVTLPDEVILKIMQQLDPEDLYCIRQTCVRFMAIFNGPEFQQHHEVCEYPRGYASFCPRSLSIDQRNRVARCLTRHGLCSACLEFEACGAYDSKRRRLLEPQYCQGCNEDHHGALFFPEDIKTIEAMPSESIQCIGRRVEMRLCGHLSDHEPVTWDHLHHLGETTACCIHASHQPRVQYQRSLKDTISVFPRFVSRLSRNSRRYIGYGWDLPLVDLPVDNIYGEWRITNSAIRHAVSSRLESALQYHRVCPHVLESGKLDAFVDSGICECFSDRFKLHAYDETWQCNCKGRQAYLECKICGALYQWLNLKGRLHLSYRFIWDVRKPTSLGWLSLMSRRDRDRIFTEDTKHLLWCDTPSCMTTRLALWEGLVKDNAAKSHDSGQVDANHTDYSIMRHMSNMRQFQSW